LLSVIIGEKRAFLGDSVDVGRVIAHHAAIVGADVPVADVVAHDDEDVGSLLGGLSLRRQAKGQGAQPQRQPCRRFPAHPSPSDFAQQYFAGYVCRKGCYAID
jgi:hypothetical protein